MAIVINQPSIILQRVFILVTLHHLPIFWWLIYMNIPTFSLFLINIGAFRFINYPYKLINLNAPILIKNKEKVGGK